MKIFLVIALALLGCSSQNSYEEKESQNTLNSESKITHPQQEDTVKIENSIGVISLTDKYSFGQPIQVFDKNKEKIEPITINEETEVFALRCLSIKDNYYKVIFSSGQVGFVVKSEVVEYQTWEKHILQLFAVDFNSKENPIKQEPNKSAQTKTFNQDEFYHPVEVKGDWLKIKWGSQNNWEYGWIKWREGEQLLIELYYFA